MLANEMTVRRTALYKLAVLLEHEGQRFAAERQAKAAPRESDSSLPLVKDCRPFRHIADEDGVGRQIGRAQP